MDIRAVELGFTNQENLGFALSSRTYGTLLQPKNRFAQPLPPALLALQSEMEGELKLLRLEPHSGLTSGEIFEAYRSDITFLRRRYQALKRCTEAAIQYSTRLKKDGEWDSYGNSQKEWQQIDACLPQFSTGPSLDLSADRANLPPLELLAEIKEEAGEAVERLLKQFCFWLDELVQSDRIGLFRAVGPEVGHYYYFLTEREQNQTTTRRQDVAYDASQRDGQRTTYSDVERKDLRLAEVTERHDHHIIQMKVRSVADFPDPMPERVKNFLENVPPWLLKHMVVVSGVITKEVRTRRGTAEDHQFDERVISTYKGSPAVALAHYAFNGWNDDDLKQSAAFSPLQKVFGTARSKNIRRVFRHSLGGGALAVTCIFGVYSCTEKLIAEEDVKAATEYATFMESVGPGHFVEIGKGKSVTLPSGQPLFYFGGSFKGQPTYLTIATDKHESWQLNNRLVESVKYDGGRGYCYGTMDLGPKMGVPAHLKITACNETKLEGMVQYYDR